MTAVPPPTCWPRSAKATSCSAMPPTIPTRRQDLAARGAWACIKPMPNRRNVPAFSSFLYRYRNLVERFFNKLKHFRAVATRYDKSPENFLAGIQLASARIWMR
jgi:transposase